MMTQPYTDADVELVARAGFEHSGMHEWEDITNYMRDEWRSVARKLRELASPVSTQASDDPHLHLETTP